jgi:hypothetical protein
MDVRFTLTLIKQEDQTVTGSIGVTANIKICRAVYSIIAETATWKIFGKRRCSIHEYYTDQFHRWASTSILNSLIREREGGGGLAAVGNIRHPTWTSVIPISETNMSN